MSKAFDEWWLTIDPYVILEYDVAKAAWNAALASIGHCKCTMAQKMVGDGCNVCNPTAKREIDAYNEGYGEGYKDALTDEDDRDADAKGQDLYGRGD